MIIIENLSRKPTKNKAFWFMRQAGRYLPEYKKVRSNFPNFLEFCYNYEAASEVTLQPIKRFDMSAAIIFSDILVIPHALGINVEFHENIGPVLPAFIDGNINKNDIFNSWSVGKIEEKLDPVYRAISLTRKNLQKEKSLIGFCGSAWTLACYILEGKSSRDFAKARIFALKEKTIFGKIIDILVDMIVKHSCLQIKAGADVIQLFDSWSGVLSEFEFEEYVIKPTKKIVSKIRTNYPEIKIIGFPRMCGEKIKSYAEKTGVDAVSFDGSISLDYFNKEVEKHVVAQGNLDSIILAEDKKIAIEQTKKIISNFNNKSFIFNLAHGILPHTPIENVQAVSDVIKDSI